MRRLVFTVAALLILTAPVLAQEKLSAFERARQEAEVLRQRTLAKIREQLDGVEPLVAANRFGEAELKLQTAERLAKTGDELSPEERAAIEAEIAQLSAKHAEAKAAYMAVREEQTEKQITERERQRRLAEKMFAERQIESHWAQLRQFRDRRQYDEALAEANAILKRRPEDWKAARTAVDMAYLGGLSRQIDLRQDRRSERRLAMVDTEESGTPWLELHRYPPAKEWELMSIRRLSNLARQLGYLEDLGVSEAQLEKRVDLNVNAVSMANVMSYLSEAAGIPIIADPHIAEDTSRSPEDETVTMDVKNLTLRQILDMMMPEEWGWRVSEGNIVISSREKANPLRVITYPIQHMIAEIPQFDNAPRMDIAQAMQQTGGQGGGGGGGADLWGDFGEETGGPPPQDRIKDLIVRFVKSTDPKVAAWEDEGGPATIEYFNGTLIISQTEAGHRKVAALLARL